MMLPRVARCSSFVSRATFPRTQQVRQEGRVFGLGLLHPYPVVAHVVHNDLLLGPTSQATTGVAHNTTTSTFTADHHNRFTAPSSVDCISYARSTSRFGTLRPTGRVSKTEVLARSVQP